MNNNEIETLYDNPDVNVPEEKISTIDIIKDKIDAENIQERVRDGVKLFAESFVYDTVYFIFRFFLLFTVIWSFLGNFDNSSLIKYWLVLIVLLGITLILNIIIVRPSLEAARYGNLSKFNYFFLIIRIISTCLVYFFIFWNAHWYLK